MSWSAPTAAELKARFPVFAAVSADIVTAAIGEAAAMVDESWTSEEDFRLGRMLLAAHYLTLDGLGTSNEAQFAGFKRLKIGSLELERASATGETASGFFASTAYGRRFRDLLRLNRPPIAVV